jgi:hypothetical protein
LLEALDGIERLVLLGDVIELIERRPTHAMRDAEPVLRAIGRRLGGDREVVIVPGNHDLLLIEAWLHAGHDEELAPASQVPVDATPALARVASWLAPARVDIRYPGAWLSTEVWATHGHYLNRHLLPESAVGIARGSLRRLPRDGARPRDYERIRPSQLRRLPQWLPGPLIALGDDLAEVMRAATMPKLLHPRMAPVTATLLGTQVSRASIPAMARVVHRLGVDARWVVFGHVHRLGPLDGDRPGQWEGPGGRPRLLNTGCWLYEPLLVHRAAPPHPYWPGGAVLLEDGRDPVVYGLLDDLRPEDLH